MCVYIYIYSVNSIPKKNEHFRSLGSQEIRYFFKFFSLAVWPMGS